MKSKQMIEFLDGFTLQTFGNIRSESIEHDICVCCGQPAVEFKDELSKKEFSISGMCQNCQDSVFGA